jgi:ribonuclease BN (tRNA processing enzyme)
VDAVAITHWHLDHWGDLVPWVWGQTLGPGIGAARAELWVPPHGRKKLETFGGLLGTPDMFDEAFEVREYQEAAEFEAAGFTITAHRVMHYELAAYGLRIVDPATRTVVAYSGDSGPSDALAELARDADLFVCEATLGRPNPEDEPRGHLSADEALGALRASGAKRLLITHRPDERPLEIPDLEVARDGMQIDLQTRCRPPSSQAP